MPLWLLPLLQLLPSLIGAISGAIKDHPAMQSEDMQAHLAKLDDAAASACALHAACAK